MYRHFLFILIFCYIANNSYAKTYYPEDLASFIQKRDQCDHFRGEVSGEPEIDNARNLNVKLERYCKGTDSLLKNLKIKYKNSNVILSKLDSYEEGIEPNTINDVDFKKYQVAIYRKPVNTPKGYTQKGDIWVDEYGRAINPPQINFAGEYYIALHSCGTGCRYYTLFDLTKNKNISLELKPFGSGEKKINSLDNYFIDLIYKSDSYLLVARYYKNIDSEEYRDCLFKLVNNKIKKIESQKCPMFN